MYVEGQEANEQQVRISTPDEVAGHILNNLDIREADLSTVGVMEVVQHTTEVAETTGADPIETLRRVGKVVPDIGAIALDLRRAAIRNSSGVLNSSQAAEVVRRRRASRRERGSAIARMRLLRDSAV